MTFQPLTTYFEELLPDEEIRKACMELLRDHITVANSISPNSWTVYLERENHMPVFLVNTYYTFCIKTNLSSQATSSIIVFVPKDSLSEADRKKLGELKCSITDGFKGLPYGNEIHVPIDDKEKFFSALEIIKTRFPKYLAKLIKKGNHTGFKKQYNPEIVKYINTFLQANVPNPEYFPAIPPDPDPDPDPHPISKIKIELLSNYFSAKGFAFSPEQIANFYTGLQTKGFVILSGISGTGKTKLAQHFAALLQHKTIALVGAYNGPVSDANFPTDKVSADWWTYPIRNDVAKRLTLPFRQYIYHNGEIKHVFTVSDFKTQPGKNGMVSPWPDLTPPSDVNKTHVEGKPDTTFQTWFKVSQRAKLENKLSLQQLSALFNYSNVPQALINGFLPVIDPLNANSNLLFLSVRPDWRDSKAILGYYNPIMQKYEWTPFLRFLLKAENDYRINKDHAAPWFVIMDEMNLARVEYYFADLLSVLESGRGVDGWTNEPIRLVIPEGIKNDCPASEIFLPPNLYIIGTVNMDETTHAFSPKVLDRAFTMELTEADFNTYPPAIAGNVEILASQHDDILQNFTHQGQFTCFNKNAIRTWVEANSAYRERLQSLNSLLRPFDLHFAYRVFDEIIMFMISAEGNQLYQELGGLESAFDVAVLMKVLPKFHGSRGKLEIPLLSILAWCKKPDSPDFELVKSIPSQADSDPSLRNIRGQIDQFKYPKTAGRVLRMIVSLYSIGFTSFG